MSRTFRDRPDGPLPRCTPYVGADPVAGRGWDPEEAMTATPHPEGAAVLGASRRASRTECRWRRAFAPAAILMVTALAVLGASGPAGGTPVVSGGIPPPAGEIAPPVVVPSDLPGRTAAGRFSGRTLSLAV